MSSAGGAEAKGVGDRLVLGIGRHTQIQVQAVLHLLLTGDAGEVQSHPTAVQLGVAVLVPAELTAEKGLPELPEPDRIRTVERHRVDHRHGMVRPFSAGLPHGFVGHRSSLVKGQVGAPDACSGCGCRRHRTWIPVGRVRSARGQPIAPTGTASPSGRPRQPCRRLTAKLVMRVLFPSPAPHSKSPQQKGIPSLDIPCARNRLRPACN